MSEWSAEEFQQFMKAQLGSLELTGKATILLGEYSQTKVTQEWLTALLMLLFNGSFQRKLFQKKVALSLQKTVWIIIFSALVEEIPKQKALKWQKTFQLRREDVA